MNAKVVILDCYTDEPSGYGVRPYLGTHQLHLSQALASTATPHSYLTIDDLRYNKNGRVPGNDTDLRTLNTTANRDSALDLLRDAGVIYVIMGCFVDYAYFSCVPPRSGEVYEYLRDTVGKKILFYVMGTLGGISPDYAESQLRDIVADVEHGNTYRYVIAGHGSSAKVDLINPDYPLLGSIGRLTPPLLEQLSGPIIAEIETGTGCNTPTCKFCIEAARSPRVTYRRPEDIVAQVGCLYDAGVRHFRLGRQPNFFHFQRQNTDALERLLAGIRERCPELRMLHIDNVNIVNVVTPAGRQIARLVAKYCTSGNVTPFGIESFDENVRRATRVAGSTDDVIRAVEIINEAGAERGVDGLPKLLPGINLIHGLPGASDTTHDRNMSCLRRIMDEGLMTYRTYYRMLAEPTGVSLREPTSHSLAFESCFQDVVESFVLPMQTRVYPPGTIIRGDWECITASDISYARTLGTCSIKVRLESPLPAGTRSMAVRVVGNASYRVLHGQLASMV